MSKWAYNTNGDSGMSTIKSSDEHLTLNADGASKDIKFQANGVEKASISSAGAFTSTTIDATKLTGDLPAISGANLTGVGVAGITSSADATAMTIDSSEKIGIGTASPLAKLDVSGNNGSGGYVGVIRNDTNSANYHGLLVSTMYDTSNSTVLHLKTNTATPTTGGTDLLKVTGDGIVTMPKQPAFLVNARQSAPNIAVNTNTTAQFTEEVYDVNADYNTSTYTFTAPVTGKYQLNCSLLWINWDASANYYYLKIVTSNRTYYELFNGGERSSDVTYAYGHIHVLADMDANDTAYIELYQNGGAEQTNYENQSVFGGFLAC